MLVASARATPGRSGGLLRRIREAVRRTGHALRSSALGLPIARRWRGRQLRRLRPFADGRPRGQAIVRYYWDAFLDTHRADVRGRCLEIGPPHTARRIGGRAVTSADGLDLTRHDDAITVVADLSRADEVPGGAYDCVLVPFTLHLIYDVEAALYHSVRLLRPGGVLLANFPCVDYYFPCGLDMATGRPLYVYWWFTPIQVDNLLRRVGLGGEDYGLRIDGNLFARIAYQLNLPVEELSRAERDTVDPGHPLLICARAVRPPDWRAPRPPYRDAWHPDVTPTSWNPVTGHYPPATPLSRQS